ncbi:MAG TPA: hypothetical protein PLH15_07755 [Spirochaetota bacterium]|jgi:tetratricopeptide (TPR) repeat protein|nr:hypothetical protein [Spirochaetota bacterium]HPA64552.1 hypothetical protein [Spirochaetota bacterium]HPJ14361.1 hypothetical protein [Spirochaetota bacterium]HQQ23717.1 hypothetical protein [Spirochaetota bacterium]
MKHFVLLILVPFLLIGAELKKTENKIRIFYTYNSYPGVEASVKGKVLQLGTREISSNEILQSAQRKTKISVRLFDRIGILPGDTLYIIDDKNLIVAKLSVEVISKTKNFGWLLIGYGNFRRTSPDMRVCSITAESNLTEAKYFKGKGDYYISIGDLGNAIAMYEKSVQKSKTYPDPHIALGEIYLEKNISEYALKEYDEAYKYFSNVYDKQDRFDLLRGMVLTRYKMIYESVYTGISSSKSSEKMKSKLRKEAVSFGLKALEIDPANPDVNFYLGRFFYETENPDDKKSKEYLLKCIESDPEYQSAYIILSKLYLRHKNPNKAKEYAETALRLKPEDEAAKNIMKRINE